MLTRQGWLVTIGAAVLIGAGRVLGVLELRSFRLWSCQPR